MAIFELDQQERGDTHLWKITWNPGNDKSGFFVLAYSMDAIGQWLKAAYHPRECTDQELARMEKIRFQCIAESLQDHFDDPKNTVARKIEQYVGMHPVIKGRNGEIAIEIAPGSKAPAPATVLQSFLQRPLPFIRISPCNPARRMVREAFIDEAIVIRALDTMDGDKGPGSPPSGLLWDKPQKQPQARAHAAAQGASSPFAERTAGSKGQAPTR